jgi:hypothetical protein
VIRWLINAALIGGIALRLFSLDADPDYYAWVGYITDEGRWVAHARELALFGQVINHDWLLHLLLAPLSQAAHYATFELLGVSIWTARLPTALSGCALLVVFWILLRHVATSHALLAGLALLAFEVDLIVLSRVAVPEMASLLLQLLSYGLLVTGRPSLRRLFAGWVVLLLAVATKATTLPTLAIFSAIVLFQPLGAEAAGRRGRSLVAFWAGFLTPIILTAPIWIVAARRAIPALMSNIGMLGGFIHLSRPGDVATFPFHSELAPVFAVWALGACLVLTGQFAGQSKAADPQLRRYFATSASWYGLYASLMVSLGYFPDRYKLHILVPLAVNISAGISLFQASGSVAASSARNEPHPARGLVHLVLLSLPTGVLWAPLLVAGVGTTAVDATRLRVKLFCVAVAVICTLWVAHRRVRAGRSLLFLAVFPVVGVLVWLLSVRIRIGDGSFWPGAGAARPAWWSAGILAAALITVLVMLTGRRWNSTRWAALVPAAVLCYAVLSVARIAPGYAYPHYSIRDTSRILGDYLAGEPGVIATSSAEGLFIESTGACHRRPPAGRRASAVARSVAPKCPSGPRFG